MGGIFGNLGNSGKRYHDQIGGKAGAEAARRAGRIQVGAVNEAIDAYGEMRPAYDPYIEAGNQAFNTMQQGSTIDGYGQRMDDIRGSSVYDLLRNERQGAATQQYADAGLRRNSAMGDRAADISMQTLMGIEGDLYGRAGNIASTGYDALNRDTGLQQGIADLMVNRGIAKAGGVLGSAAANAQGASNRYASMHNAGTSVMGMFGGGGGGGDMQTQAPGGSYQQQPSISQYQQNQGGGRW